MALPLPITHIIVDGKEVEVFRCETDKGLVIRTAGYDSQALFQAHAGHEIKQPVTLRDGEMQEIFDEIGIMERYDGR